MVVEEIEDFLADFLEFLFDLLAVIAGHLLLLLAASAVRLLLCREMSKSIRVKCKSEV